MLERARGGFDRHADAENPPKFDDIRGEIEGFYSRLLAFTSIPNGDQRWELSGQ